MSHKSEANQLIQTYFQFINKQVDNFIKAIGTGNAKEFQLNTFLQKVGLHISFLVRIDLRKILRLNANINTCLM